MTVDLYLTDEFVEFSKQMAELHAKKTEKQAEYRKLLEAAKADLKTIDETATALKAKWDQFVEAHQKK